MRSRIVFSEYKAGRRMRRHPWDRQRPSKRRRNPTIKLEDLVAAAGNNSVMDDALLRQVVSYTWEEKKKFISAHPPDPQATARYNLRHVDICLASARIIVGLECWEEVMEGRRG